MFSTVKALKWIKEGLTCVLVILIGIGAAGLVVKLGAPIKPPVVCVAPQVVSSIDRMLDATVTVCVVSSEEESSGSGVVISQNGIIATAKHVVKDVDSVLVVFRDGRIEIAQTWIESKTADVALIFTGSDCESYQPLSMLDPSPGEKIFACGSPFGMTFQNLLTAGVVSKYPVWIPELSDSILIAHDAFVTFGSSGGPVFDSQGNVIGITLGFANGVYLATPSCEVINLLETITRY